MAAQLDAFPNPLSDVPVLGGIIGKVDEAVIQLGLPLWLRAMVELLIIAALAYLLLLLLTNHVLPWAATALVEPLVTLTDGVRVVLLLPDLAIAWSVRHFGRVPPEPVYAYGRVVMNTMDAVQQVVRRALPMLEITRKARPWMLISVLALGFLLWNSSTCDSGDGSTCSTPVTVWTTSFHTWIDSQG